jgi:lipopolysaccharide/colanic/teichoic acid biosynthesis glycosyltransferase
MQQSHNILTDDQIRSLNLGSVDQRRLRSYEWNKRFMDIVITLPMFMVALPILLLCMIMMKLDSKGPIFYVQKRTGKGGRRFKMLKLRTMVVNAEELKEQLQHLNQLSYPDFKVADDPRITRTGRFFRKTSLDELPQLVNVLKGDMSLVGPRPTSFCSSTYNLWHTARLQVTPGITGLWQISGRSDIDFDERARLDITYIRNRSIGMDFRILLRTVSCVISNDGAY